MERAKQQEVIDAILMTTERLNPSGELWCHPKSGEILKRVIADRSKSLWGLSHQAVRLMRLMSRASGRGYSDFLYCRLSVLRTYSFEREIAAAFASGQLNGIARANAGVNVQTGDDDEHQVIGKSVRRNSGVQFIEAEMASDEGPFNLAYAQMGRIAAFIDILHNMLGFEEIEKLVAAVTGPKCKAAAVSVAKELDNEVRSWLRQRTVSDHTIRQTRTIRTFLTKSFDDVNSDSIDDGAIFEFWRSQSVDPLVDGFRQFRSAARAMVSYRDALITAQAEIRQENEAHFSEVVSEGPIVGLAGSVDDIDELDHVGSSPSVASSDDWISPLAALMRIPTEKVNLLFKKDYEFLSHYLGQQSSSEDYSAEEEVADGEAGDPTLTLFQNRPDPSLFLTLMRYSYFGGVQNAIVSRLRGQRKTKKDDRGRLEGVLIEGGGYAGVTALYEKLLDELQIITLQVARHLVGRRRPESIALAVDFGLSAKDMIDASPLHDPGVIEMPERAHQLAMEIAEKVIVKRYEMEARRVARRGLKEEDFDNAEITELLASGSMPLIELRRELNRLVRWLAKSELHDLFLSDVKLFKQQFQQLYAEQWSCPQ